MTGIYLQCEICKKNLGGEEVSDEKYGLKSFEHRKLRNEAKKLGWLTIENINLKYSSQYNLLDYCPNCAKGITK